MIKSSKDSKENILVIWSVVISETSREAAAEKAREVIKEGGGACFTILERHLGKKVLAEPLPQRDSR